jgi:anti-sigma B factor antagonist
MRFEAARDGAQAAVALHGDLDIEAAPELRALLTELLEAGVTALVIDVSDLEFMDSSGLGVLVSSHRRLSRYGGKLRVVGANHAVARVIEVTGLDRVFDLA